MLLNKETDKTLFHSPINTEIKKYEHAGIPNCNFITQAKMILMQHGDKLLITRKTNIGHGRLIDGGGRYPFMLVQMVMKVMLIALGDIGGVIN